VDRDARSLPGAAQEELRRRAIRLVSEGRSQVEVAAIVGVRRQAVGRWVKAWRGGGERALAAGRRGRRGGHTKLSLAHQERIAVLIAGKNPDQLRLPGFLWTRALVCELIEREYGVCVTEETVGRYLRAWGFSPQKPMRRAFEQSDEAVRVWLEERYPEIERRARAQGAEILWADEMGLRSDHQTGRSWAPVGQTPVVKGTGKRFKTNVIAAISNNGTLRFRVFGEHTPTRSSCTSCPATHPSSTPPSASTTTSKPTPSAAAGPTRSLSSSPRSAATCAPANAHHTSSPATSTNATSPTPPRPLFDTTD
jgi:transposase